MLKIVVIFVFSDLFYEYDLSMDICVHVCVCMCVRAFIFLFCNYKLGWNILTLNCKFEYFCVCVI